MEDNIKSLLAPSVLQELTDASSMLKDLNSPGGVFAFKAVCESIAALVNATRDQMGTRLTDEESQAYTAFMLQALQKASTLIA